MGNENNEVDLLTYLLQSVVSKPESLRVERRVDEMGVLLEVSADPQDMGILIGREGSNARAVRTLMHMYGMRNQKRINVKIIEPAGRERPQREFRPRSFEKRSVENFDFNSLNG